jgi:hypothetical protein
MMEYWNVGFKEKRTIRNDFLPLPAQYSIIPTIHYSIIPILRSDAEQSSIPVDTFRAYC